VQTQRLSQVGKQSGSPGERGAHRGERGQVACHRTQDLVESLQALVHLSIGRTVAQKGADRPDDLQTPVVERERREIKRESLVGPVGPIIEHPLREAPHHGEAAASVRNPVTGVGRGEPATQAVASFVDGGPEPLTVLPNEDAQPGDDLGLPKEGAQLVMPVGEQVLADIREEVVMAGEDRNRLRQRSDELLGRVRHRPAEVAHDRAGRPERLGDLVQGGQDEFGPFGRHFPRAQAPAPPASEGHEQRASAVFAGRVEMQRPAAIGLERRAERRGGRVMERLEIGEEPAGQGADFSRREHDAVVPGQRRANLLALMVVHESLEADRHHHVIADHAARRQDRGERRGAAPDGCVGLSAAGRAGVDGLLQMKRPVRQRHAVTASGFLHVHAAPTRRAPRRWVVERDEEVAELMHPSLTRLAQRGRFRPHRGERGEGERAVFFRS
jgi:hypothetical protein